MEGAERLRALVPLTLALAACTMVGTPETSSPAPTSSEVVRVSDPGRRGEVVRAAEPPSRGGNMVEYEEMGGRYRVLESSYGYDESGVASWYGEPFHGRQTSSGERFDMNRLSAAHRPAEKERNRDATQVAIAVSAGPHPFGRTSRTFATWPG